MAPTGELHKTVRNRAKHDPDFRRKLLCGALEALLDGELSAGKSSLRDYINATIGFEGLAAQVGTPAKSIHRMFGPRGNPNSASLFSIISVLQNLEKVRFQVSASDGH